MSAMPSPAKMTLAAPVDDIRLWPVPPSSVSLAPDALIVSLKLLPAASTLSDVTVAVALPADWVVSFAFPSAMVIFAGSTIVVGPMPPQMLVFGEPWIVTAAVLSRITT